MSTATDIVDRVVQNLVRRDAEKAEQAIIEHFGTEERARRMLGLFKDRYIFERKEIPPRNPFVALFGPEVATPVVSYRVIDTFRLGNK
jgi:hypothetical protein